MAWTMHALFVRHHIRPGEFWSLPRGEQIFLAASLELELDDEKNWVERLRGMHGK